MLNALGLSRCISGSTCDGADGRLMLEKNRPRPSPLPLLPLPLDLSLTPPYLFSLHPHPPCPHGDRLFHVPCGASSPTLFLYVCTTHISVHYIATAYIRLSRGMYLVTSSPAPTPITSNVESQSQSATGAVNPVNHPSASANNPHAINTVLQTIAWPTNDPFDLTGWLIPDHERRRTQSDMDTMAVAEQFAAGDEEDGRDTHAQWRQPGMAMVRFARAIEEIAAWNRNAISSEGDPWDSDAFWCAMGFASPGTFSTASQEDV
ncbi:hypothetical protein B0H13DRAFT_2683175 [Mycena leptocephala]|nr:hypothetical protein B0H13DRAFT_2683175 [Mycena leptocephala]